MSIPTVAISVVLTSAVWLLALNWVVQHESAVSLFHVVRNRTDESFAVLTIAKAMPPVHAAPLSAQQSQSSSSDALTRRVFPQHRPRVCLCFLSCGRLHLLERSMNAAVGHLETSEPDLPYEIVWVDNGSPPHELAAVRRRLPPVEKLAALGANNGIAFGLNTAFFRLCSAPYIVSLEEDWAFAALAPPLATPARERILEHSIAVIDADSGIAGVILRNETYDQFTAPRGWLRMARDDGVELEYRHYCAPIAGGVVYGAYTNGASIYSRERLLSLGSGIYGEPDNAVGFPPSYSEANYATRVALKYPCSAMIRTRTDCELIGCMGVFEHIGEGHSIMTAQTNADLARGQNISWVLYDTPLFGRYQELLQQLKRAA